MRLKWAKGKWGKRIYKSFVIVEKRERNKKMREIKIEKKKSIV